LYLKDFLSGIKLKILVLVSKAEQDLAPKYLSDCLVRYMNVDFMKTPILCIETSWQMNDVEVF